MNLIHNNNGDIMKNRSIWKENVKNIALSSLNKDIKCDILIIGGGVAGLSTAYFLSNSNKNIVLIDKDKCAEGASSKNTGKLTFVQELVYNKLVKNYSNQVAKFYLESQKEAISLAIDIINKNDIECNLFKQDSYVFINKDSDTNKLESEISFYKKNNIDCEKVNELPMNFSIKTGIRIKDSSYSFNPYKFLIGVKNVLKDKIKIYENTRAIEVKKDDDCYLVKTGDDKIIKCKSVVVATQYPFFIVPYFTPFKTTVEKSFIVGGIDEIMNFQAISEGKPTISFNYYKDNKGYLLYSRRSHSITTKLDTRQDRNEIVNEYKKYFNSEPDYYFQNHDLMTYDYMPLIGKIDDNMYVLTGFNKWGNTNGIIGGKLIGDLIIKKENKYVDIFNPKRGISFLKIKNLTIYNTMVMTRYILNKIVTSKSYYDDRVRIEYIDGKKCGIYTDENGEHIVSNICPHMKCNLVFNYVDKTWDCPCHASRFDIDGNVIYGPSVYDIKIDKM